MSRLVGTSFLFDVGQGSAALVRVRDQVVVVDCGYSGEEILDYLQDRSLSMIHCLVLSHNDADHARGLIQLLNAYSGRIEHLWYQVDFPSLSLKDKAGAARRRLFKAISDAEDDGRIGQSHYLHTTEEYAGLQLWISPPARLELLYPLPREHRAALLAGDPNQACGVLRFVCGDGTVLFAGDAPLDVWVAVEQRDGSVQCDVLTVPHHGGQIHRNAEATPLCDRICELIRLYREVVRTTFAIVSVGTTNSYAHPLPEHIYALRASGRESCVPN